MELMVAVFIAVILIGIATSAYILVQRAYSVDSAGSWLQNSANAVLTKIIKGETEPGGVFRLSEATSYNIVSISELHFTGTDGTERWFRLDNTSTSVIYHYPTSAGTTDETIYTAPSGATITLRFSTPVGPQYSGVVVGIDVAIFQNQSISGAIKTVSGSASTYVNIRNHPV